MNCLIIGGSSGLGFSLAKALAKNNDVHVTGRRDPKETGITFHSFALDGQANLFEAVSSFIAALPKIDLFIYAAGYFQDGRTTDLSQAQIQEMLDVGLVAPIYFVRELLEKQAELPGFIAITSTSQWTPRLLEPVYTAVKAGLGAFANSTSLDPRVKKTLVAGPAGMKTRFWDGTDKDTSTMLDPDWVADEILKLYADDYSYRYSRILREPARVEEQETRK